MFSRVYDFGDGGLTWFLFVRLLMMFVLVVVWLFL